MLLRELTIAYLVVITSLLILPKDLTSTRGRFDPAGAFLLAVGLIALTLGLSFGQQWGSPVLIATLVSSGLAFLLLVVVEQRVTDPVIDLSLLRNRVFLSANVSLMMSFLALFAASFLLPFYLDELRGFSIVESGLLRYGGIGIRGRLTMHHLYGNMPLNTQIFGKIDLTHASTSNALQELVVPKHIPF